VAIQHRRRQDWIDLPASVQAKKQVSGLTVGSTAMFRYRAVTPKLGQGDWVAPISYLVQ
jgi:hypothetical protein